MTNSWSNVPEKKNRHLTPIMIIFVLFQNYIIFGVRKNHFIFLITTGINKNTNNLKSYLYWYANQMI